MTVLWAGEVLRDKGQRKNLNFSLLSNIYIKKPHNIAKSLVRAVGYKVGV